jgi:DNA-binding NarL/FixJ family response regulator
VVADTSTAHKATAAASKHHPDAILVDASLDEALLLATIADVRTESPQSSIVVLGDGQPLNFTSLVQAGIAGYLTWNTVTGAGLGAALAAVEMGWWVSAPSLLHHALGPDVGDLSSQADVPSTSAEGGIADLSNDEAWRSDRVATAINEMPTKRELEVLEPVLRGFSDKEIAARISRSPRTVQFHLRNL